MSRSELEMPTIRNAFSMSAVTAIGYNLNLISMLNNFGMKFGPTCRQSFREQSSLIDLAEPSLTIRRFVVLWSEKFNGPSFQGKLTS